jgi:hypothetical protein
VVTGFPSDRAKFIGWMAASAGGHELFGPMLYPG